jgi:hypothetical protein
MGVDAQFTKYGLERETELAESLEEIAEGVGGSETLGGVEYKYFEYGDDIYGLNENLIFNNNDNGTQLADFNLTFEDGVQDYFFQVTADGATLIDSPGGGGGVTPPQPEPEAVDGPKIYIKNSTTWGGNLFAHYWGTSSTEWPGKQFEEKVTVGEDEFLVIPTLHKDIASEVGISDVQIADGMQLVWYYSAFGDEIPEHAGTLNGLDSAAPAPAAPAQGFNGTGIAVAAVAVVAVIGVGAYFMRKRNAA